MLLVELMQMLFEQFKCVAQAHAVLLSNISRAAKAHNVDLKLYDINFFWMQVQAVFQSLLNDYLDVQNISAESQLLSSDTSTSDVSSFFSRRKPQSKKKMLFKFDGSSSALTMSSLKDTSFTMRSRNKLFVCPPDPNNITVLFIPVMCFVETIENSMGLNQG